MPSLALCRNSRCHWLSPAAGRDEKSFPHPQPSPIAQSTSTVESKLPPAPWPSWRHPNTGTQSQRARSSGWKLSGKSDHWENEIGGSLRSGPAPHLWMRRQASRKTAPRTVGYRPLADSCSLFEPTQMDPAGHLLRACRHHHTHTHTPKYTKLH